MQMRLIHGAFAIGCAVIFGVILAHAEDKPAVAPEPALQGISLTADEYKTLINQRIGELIRQDSVAQMLIQREQEAQAKAKQPVDKPGG